MKKTLLAAALLTGFAGVAQAETSVTLYGILDGGLGYQHISGDRVDSVSKLGMTQGVQSGNRWGLRGEEDLADGLKVHFTLEAGFNLGDGTRAQGERLFGRQATVGVSGEWGRIDFGRQTNVASNFFSSIDPFAEGFAGAGVGSTFSSADTTRYDNTFVYQSPMFDGFQLSGGYSFNVDNTNKQETSFAATNNTRAVTLGGRYMNGPVNVALVYDQLNRATQSSGTGDSKIRAWILGGTYDFEVAKLALAFGQMRGGWIQGVALPIAFTGGGADTLLNTDSNNKVGDMSQTTFGKGFKAKQYMLGVSAPLEEATHVFASWQRAIPSGEINFPNITANNGSMNNMDIYSIGMTYDLSKRTNFYALGSYTKGYQFEDNVKSMVLAAGLRYRF